MTSARTSAEFHQHTYMTHQKPASKLKLDSVLSTRTKHVKKSEEQRLSQGSCCTTDSLLKHRHINDLLTTKILSLLDQMPSSAQSSTDHKELSIQSVEREQCGIVVDPDSLHHDHRTNSHDRFTPCLVPAATREARDKPALDDPGSPALRRQPGAKLQGSKPEVPPRNPARVKQIYRLDAEDSAKPPRIPLRHPARAWKRPNPAMPSSLPSSPMRFSGDPFFPIPFGPAERSYLNDSLDRALGLNSYDTLQTLELASGLSAAQTAQTVSSPSSSKSDPVAMSLPSPRRASRLLRWLTSA